jgi:uncharacterized repeat protein (TIGR01451 family)
MQTHISRGPALKRPCFLPTLEQLEDRTTPATITVTGTGDTIAVDGAVTLREAIQSIDQGSDVNSDVTAHRTGTYGTNDTIVFNIPGTGVHTINITSALPAITRTMLIDGTTQATNSGDTPPQVGTGGTVGVGPDGIAGTGDELALPTVARPDIEIHGTNAIGSGWTISANNVDIRGLAIYGFGTANINIAQNSNNTIIEQNILGTTASSFTDPGAGVRTLGANILNSGGGTNNGIIRNNLIGFAGGSGIDLSGGAATYQITGNEIRSNGLSNTNGAGIALGNQNSVNETIRGNLIVGDSGFGVNMLVSNGNDTVNQNTITGNGVGGTQTAGIGSNSSGDTITNNIISANYGAGVLVDANAARNTTSKNSIIANGTIQSASGAPATGQIGIDLLTPSDNQNTGTSPFVTLNRPNGQNQSGGNGLLNFPVFTNAVLSGGNLELDGFARPGSVIELFIADPDPSGFGEGKTYVTTLTEGSAQDLDSGTGTYGPSPINGLLQGTDTTNRFKFIIPVASLPVAVGVGSVLTSTATLANDTSEFSGNIGVTQPTSDLALTKTVSNLTPNVGDTITFTVTLTNNGPNNATGVTVSDTLPSGLALVTASPSQGTYTGGVWTVGAVPVGARLTLTLTATVNSPDPQTNTSSILSADQPDPNPANNTASATATPQQADLLVAKTVSNITPNVGDTITYTITVTNTGTDTATNVSLSDALPAQVSFSSFHTSSGSYDPTTHIWTIGTIGVGVTETLTLITKVVTPNPVANTAAITHSDQFDPNTANNSDTASVTPQQADLSLAKFVSKARPNVGQVITYTVRLTNNGPSTATGVRIRDVLPAGLTFVSARPSQGNYNSTTGIWTVGTVPNTASRGLQIQARVTSHSAQTNRAIISHSNQFDPVTGNNSASATIVPQQADLALSKTVDNPTPNVGNAVTFTVTLVNKGPDTATSVSVRDVLPPGLQLFSATPSQGTYANGVWSVGTVTTSAAQTLTITALVLSSGASTNTAKIRHANQFDPNASNNSASATVTPMPQNISDLAVTKTASTQQVAVGQSVIYTLTVHNLGPNPASNVSVTDRLPQGLTFVSAQPSQGSYNPTTGKWTIGNMLNGGVATLLITARVNVVAPVRNTARVTFLGVDPDLSNNVSAAAISGVMQDPSKRMLLGSSFM